MKIVIVGGVAGGASAAARLRRLDETAEIVVLERSGYVSYANCGLPYYVGDVIGDKSKLTLQTPESFKARFNIDVRTHNEVVRIDRAAHEVVVRNLDDGSEYRESYDKLILSPGAKPIVLKVEGADSKNLFVLRTVEDTFKMRDFVDKHAPKRAAVIGGGFIGIEVAENLVERGLEVALYQNTDHVLPTLDEDMAAFVHAHMREHGVELLLGADVTGFSDEADGIAVKTATDQRHYDMAVMAVGVVPETSLAADIGLELGIKGAIVVDEHMRTSDADIYAVGDAVQVKHLVTHNDAHIALAGPANKQGRIAADNICGRDTSFAGSLGSSVLKVFDLTVAATGLSVEAAERAGIAYDYVLLSPSSHATYYPGSSVIRLKVLFEPDSGRILGAQAVGTDGVEKRIDVLATAIFAKMSGHDLSELDLSYAPPFSSAKDPVNMAGFMIENILDGHVKQVQWGDALNLDEGSVLLDVRTQSEYDKGSVEGALHIPVDDLRARMGELPRDKRILVHCQTGLRSYLACRMLTQNGFDCANVAGGYVYYEAAHTGAAQDSANKGPCGL